MVYFCKTQFCINIGKNLKLHLLHEIYIVVFFLNSYYPQINGFDKISRKKSYLALNFALILPN